MDELSELERILLHYPDKDWDWEVLSYNVDISYKFIKEHPSLPWDWKEVALNVDIRWVDIMENPKFWPYIVTVEFLNETPSPKTFGSKPKDPVLIWNDITTSKENHDKIDWAHLSDFIDFDVVLENLHLPWDWDQISHNANDARVTDYPNLPWNWEILSYNLTEDYIKKHPDKDWCWWGISFNRSITLNFIKENIDLDLFPMPTSKPGLDRPYSRKKAWYYPNLSCNKTLTWNFILNHPQGQHDNDYYYYRWDWNALSRNPCITWKTFRDNPDRPWNWGKICQNPNVTLDLIKRKPHLPWNYKALSANPNLTLDFLKENEDKEWDWIAISDNEFGWSGGEWDYLHLVRLNYELDVLTNSTPLAKYLKMEILDDFSDLSYFEMYHIL